MLMWSFYKVVTHSHFTHIDSLLFAHKARQPPTRRNFCVVPTPLLKMSAKVAFSRGSVIRRSSEMNVGSGKQQSMRAVARPTAEARNLEDANLRIVQYVISEREACKVIGEMCQEASVRLEIVDTEYKIDDILSGILILGNLYKRVGNEKGRLEAIIETQKADYKMLEESKDAMVGLGTGSFSIPAPADNYQSTKSHLQTDRAPGERDLAAAAREGQAAGHHHGDEDEARLPDDQRHERGTMSVHRVSKRTRVCYSTFFPPQSFYSRRSHLTPHTILRFTSHYTPLRFTTLCADPRAHGGHGDDAWREDLVADQDHPAREEAHGGAPHGGAVPAQRQRSVCVCCVCNL